MEALGIHKALCKACQHLRITTPTEIQKRAIPLILNKRDVVGIAPTGSGKTACYCLPILQLLSEDPYGVFALVLLPTKELAIQVYEQCQAFGSPLNFKEEIALFVGGTDWLSQTQAIAKRPYVAVATPGRLCRLLDNEDTLRCFAHLSVIVLDEADRLVTGTLRAEVDEIMSKVVSSKVEQQQFLLFTATLTPELQNYDLLKKKKEHCELLASHEQRDPDRGVDATAKAGSLFSADLVNVSSQGPAESVSLFENLEHYYLFIPSTVKLLYLIHLLQTTFKGQPAIIFTKTCQTAQLVATTLGLYELPVTSLHSLLDHRRRVAHLAKFRGSVSSLLVSTDVASRGIDIPKVNVVVNFDFPGTFEDYVHRVGRTARVGRKGVALSFICEKDSTDKVLEVENCMKLKLELLTVEEDDVLKNMTDVTKKYQEARQILYEDGFFDKAALRKEEKRKRRGMMAPPTVHHKKRKP